MPNKKILIVEDEEPIREMIVFHLSRAGFDTPQAPDCKTARQLLSDEKPDLALIDWMLPDMSGLELTRILSSGCLDSLAEDSEMPVDWAYPVSQMKGHVHRTHRTNQFEMSCLEVSGRAPKV